MARKPSEASHQSKEQPTDLNLSPIMALLVLLIPMLLLMFNFYEVTVQAVAAPKLGTGKTTPSDDAKKPLNLTVGISKSGFVVKQTEELPWEIDESCRKIDKRRFSYEIKRADGVEAVDNELNYDYPKLYSCLNAKKQTAIGRDEETLNIAADDAIPWSIVARTIDAGRVQLAEERYDDLGAYAAAEPKMRQADKDVTGDGEIDDQDTEPVYMFPRVVFAVAN